MFVLLIEAMQRKKHALKTTDSLVQWNVPGAYLEVSGPLLEVLLCNCHKERRFFLKELLTPIPIDFCPELRPLARMESWLEGKSIEREGQAGTQSGPPCPTLTFFESK